jgi:putative redox protein
MEVIGDKVSVESHSEFKTIDLHFKMNGTIDPLKALKAAELSHHKYCSVSKALEHNTVITFSVSINGKIV